MPLSVMTGKISPDQIAGKDALLYDSIFQLQFPSALVADDFYQNVFFLIAIPTHALSSLFHGISIIPSHSPWKNRRFLSYRLRTGICFPLPHDQRVFFRLLIKSFSYA